MKRMNIMLDHIIAPFADYAFMRRALAASVILSLGCTPLGIFMGLRRMTLVGDAMSHAILPGVALAFVSFGLSLLPMTFGGLLAGGLVALLAVALTRVTQLKEDASFTMLYLISLASGVTIISLKGSSVDLLHMLFGNILAIDNDSLLLIAGVTCLTLLTIAGFYRGLVIECFDPDFAQASARGRSWGSQIFFILLVLNLIAAFQALGTLMALGLMILPAIAARFWTQNIDTRHSGQYRLRAHRLLHRAPSVLLRSNPLRPSGYSGRGRDRVGVGGAGAVWQCDRLCQELEISRSARPRQHRSFCYKASPADDICGKQLSA